MALELGLEAKWVVIVELRFEVGLVRTHLRVSLTLGLGPSLEWDQHSGKSIGLRLESEGGWLLDPGWSEGGI